METLTISQVPCIVCSIEHNCRTVCSSNLILIQQELNQTCWVNAEMDATTQAQAFSGVCHASVFF
jgi:hypothetical protein